MMDLYFISGNTGLPLGHRDGRYLYGLTYFFMMFKEEKTEKSHFVSMKVSFTERVRQDFRQV
jgi:hypothetical protein